MSRPFIAGLLLRQSRRFIHVFLAGPEEPFAIIGIDYKVSFEVVVRHFALSQPFWIQDAVGGLHDYDEGRQPCLTNPDGTHWKHFFVSWLRRTSASC
jgi:hypothetical protein